MLTLDSAMIPSLGKPTGLFLSTLSVTRCWNVRCHIFFSNNTTYIVFISARYKFDGFNCSERLKSVTPIFRNNRSDLLRCTFEIWWRSQSSGDPPSGTHYINRIISASTAPRATAFPHKTPLFPSNYSTLFFLPAFYLCIINVQYQPSRLTLLINEGLRLNWKATFLILVFLVNPVSFVSN